MHKIDFYCFYAYICIGTFLCFVNSIIQLLFFIVLHSR